MDLVSSKVVLVLLRIYDTNMSLPAKCTESQHPDHCTLLSLSSAGESGGNLEIWGSFPVNQNFMCVRANNMK